MSLAALICGVLRVANRYSWLDREVYNQTVVLQQILADLSQDAPVLLEFRPNGLAMGDEEILDPPKAIRQFLGMARRKAISALEFNTNITAKETMELLRLLQNKTSLVSNDERAKLPNIDLKHAMGDGRIDLPSGGHTTVRTIVDSDEEQVEKEGRVEAADTEPDAGDGEPVVEQISPQGASTAKKSTFRSVFDKGEQSGDQVREMVADITGAIETITKEREKAEDGEANSALHDLASHLDAATEVTLILASLRAHDAYTYDHSINVGLLSIALARAIGWKGTDLNEFGMAALIHDVGKLYTPLNILNKPTRFTPQEWVVMRRHPGDGADILREAGVGSELAPRIAIEHHTNPDGTGYPPLPYKDLHTGSKIVKIADCYDAFTTIRPYRSQARPFEVLKMLRKQGGTQFDAELVEVFCEMMGVYPIGSVVQLKSGLIGLVVATNLELKDRPVVRVVQEKDHRRPREARLIDLAHRSEETGEFLDEVVECVDPVIRNIPVGRYI